MKHLGVFLFLLVAPFFAMGQDTITVMQYNLLEYGNYNSGWASCFETNNNTQTKDECIRTIIDYVKPDIFTVNEFGATQALQNDFMRHNLNINGVNYWKTDNIINYAGSTIINHIFYNSNKLGLKKHVALRTNPRDTDVYELYCKTPSLAAGDTIKLVCIVTHLKAGMNYESSRRASLQVTMDYINQHYPTDNVLIMGDFNMYGASETGYQLLTSTYSNPSICFVDPLLTVGGVGEWNENSAYSKFHTQSTLGWSDNDCRSGGGMDDRFDFILMADEIKFFYNKIRYVANSYKAVGNDGNHFNQSINQNSNNAAPAAVIDAVFECSDHLPVTMKLYVDGHLGVDDNELQAIILSPNPTRGDLSIKAQGMRNIAIFNLLGQMVYEATTHADEHIANLTSLNPGLYLVRVNTENGIVTKKVVVER